MKRAALALAATVLAACADSLKPDGTAGTTSAPEFARPGGGGSGVTVIDLGTFSGANPSQSQAFGVNDNGYIVGSSSTASGVAHAFLWTPTAPNATTGSMVDLGTLGGAYSAALGINVNRQVAGASWIPSGVNRAVLWTPRGETVDLGTFPGGTESHAYAINAVGQIVGWSSINGSRMHHAFLWTPSGQGATTGAMVDLGTLVQGGVSEAAAVNDNGQVVGWGTSGGGEHAFLWTPTAPNATTGAMTDLGTLGGSTSRARGINGLGQVVGESYTASGTLHAFYWTAAGGMVDLGTLGGSASQAFAINDRGQIAGLSRVPMSGRPGGNGTEKVETVLWAPNGAGGWTIRDLGQNANTQVGMNNATTLEVVGKSGAHATLWVVQ